MRIKEGYMLRQIADSWIVVPIGQRVVELNAIMTLSETGAFLWQRLEKDISIEGLLQQLLLDYEVDEVIARSDIEEFIESIRQYGIIE